MIGYDIPPVPSKPKQCNLLLHCGAHAVSRMDLSRVLRPETTETWHPLDHTCVLEEVETHIRKCGMQIVSEAHALSYKGNRYFGLIQVHRESIFNDDYAGVIGVRNSHDKTFPAGVVVGSQVFVCDNLAFCGEFKFGRKHTRYIERDLPELVAEAIGILNNEWVAMDRRIDAYKNKRVTDLRAHDIMIKSIDAQIVPVTALPRLLHEWREPGCQLFADRTIWSLFNAFTEVLKGNLAHLPKRTEKLHQLMDQQVCKGGIR